MRTTRITPKLEFAPKAPKSTFCESYAIELLTPMIGGGTSSWQIDQDAPIRVSEIKQQIRFWWRTMQDPTISVSSLLKKESVLFGDTKKQSPVKLSVVQSKVTKDQQIQINIMGRDTKWEGCPSYVLFPLLGQVEKTFYLLGSFSFELHLIAPVEVAEEIKRALTLWILFGGLGARTTRGAGSLYCAKLIEAISSPDELLKYVSSCAPFPGCRGNSSWPVLYDGSLAISTDGAPERKETSLTQWRFLLDSFREFRQGPGVGRGRGSGGRPGRSYWPEADSIRCLLRGGTRSYFKHLVCHPAITGNEGVFPRGAFGLPLSIEFKGDPTDPVGMYQIRPKVGTECFERWPSPIYLKIVRLGNGKIYSLCLSLAMDTPALALYMKGDSKSKWRRLADCAPVDLKEKQLLGNDTGSVGKDTDDLLFGYLKRRVGLGDRFFIRCS